MYEISGVTCSGKSTKLSAVAERCGIPILEKKYSHFIKGFYFLLRTRSLKKILYIFSKSWRSDLRYFIKAKVLCNCAAKFYYINSSLDCIIDEGLLQIPFLLLLPADDVPEFFKLFEAEISSTRIFWSSCEPEVIRDRAIKRGHHRFSGKDASYIEGFISSNIAIQTACEDMFLKKSIRVEVLNEYQDFF